MNSTEKGTFPITLEPVVGVLVRSTTLSYEEFLTQESNRIFLKNTNLKREAYWHE